MEEVKKSKDKKTLVVIIILVLLMLIGGTYAAYKFNFLGADNLLQTESIEIEFLESSGEVINLTGAFPMIDSAGIAQEETFDFQVTTRTRKNMNITYELYIEKLEADTDYTLLEDSEVKVYLTDFSDNEKTAPVKVSDLTDYTLYTQTNNHNIEDFEHKDKFKLRVWVDEDVTAKDWDENTKLQYKFKIGVRAEESFSNKTTAATMLMSKVGESGLEEVTHTADSTLQIGATEDITEYRFRGGNDVVTNNYVYFNCTDIDNQTADTCELYRIIGVFPTDDGTGNMENRIKLIKAESYGFYPWHGDSGVNNWAEPATLNTTFNTTYYNSINSSYQNLIGDAKYYLGGSTSTNVNVDVMYEYERKIDESDGGDYYYNTNPTNWTGKIALMYASDYGYGANSTCSESTTLVNYETNSCPDNNWLFLGIYEWVLPQYPSFSPNALSIYKEGHIYNDNIHGNGFEVRQVFYLTSDAQFNDIGDGSSGNPYQLLGDQGEETSSIEVVYSWSNDDVANGETKDSISGYTTDYTSLGRNYFLKHNIASDSTIESQEVCYILNSELYCLKGCSQYDFTNEVCEVTHFEENSETLLSSFGESNCTATTESVECATTGLNSFIDNAGNVFVGEDLVGCYHYSDEYAYCVEH